MDIIQYIFNPAYRKHRWVARHLNEYRAMKKDTDVYVQVKDGFWFNLTPEWLRRYEEEIEKEMSKADEEKSDTEL